ncbi:phosphatidate cytidylyltransferase [Niveibacterium sp. SC-1]|uniref:phosphatidate cytidylyltransferase n=1 Tax=Niveibacterium sp. SC-1 TaxID=3135646 RepID=UPI00311FE0C3
MLRQRVITAIVLLIVLALALFALPQWPWWLFCGGVLFAAGWEWGGLGAWASAQRWAYGAVLAALGMLVFWAQDTRLDWAAFGLSLAFWIVFVPLWLRSKWAPKGVPTVALVGLVVLLPAALALARLRDISPWLLLAIAAIVWVADICAYFGGRAFGKRKLAPSISPGKSWEGVWSGLLGVLVYGCVVLFFGLPTVTAHLGWFACVAMLVVLTALSVEGDLFESMLKRRAGIKDSSNLLPGHGGVLDRIDSLTSTLPLAALIAALWS